MHRTRSTFLEIRHVEFSQGIGPALLDESDTMDRSPGRLTASDGNRAEFGCLQVFNEQPKLPTAVLAPLTMTTSFICIPLSGCERGRITLESYEVLFARRPLAGLIVGVRSIQMTNRSAGVNSQDCKKI